MLSGEFLEKVAEEYGEHPNLEKTYYSRDTLANNRGDRLLTPQLQK